MKKEKIWLITGASQGLGLTTVKYLLSQNQTVIATTRNRENFDPEVIQHSGLEVISLDLHSEQDVKNAVDRIAEKYGRIDVLINNAGHGFIGAVEEASPEEIDEVLSINVVATLRMIRSVLPHMRAEKSGHIINLSSMAGLFSKPGVGIYNTTKYAVEGFSESLYHELKDLGIHVTILEPGAFRTNFLDKSMIRAKQIISDYDASAGSSRTRLAGNNGKQPGNPEKAAVAIYDLVNMENPPLRLLLGKDAYDAGQKKLELLKTDFERMKEVTFGTDF
ncbi:oxidoreductase [Pedobacter hartonius]|uniref:Short-chain dehydrogenase n=1 Tax=Pedobacter hartonius TaxID=425514 RepID=A0A1H4GYI4_9SPHI|nr:oxidoreductase [Pedobacter hartonius]SEB14649.1 Short-chain dehydrogenase [Pedobacter hartonius]